MIGSYYGREDLVAVAGGMGEAVGPGSNFAVETLLGILRARRPGVMAPTKPFGVMTAWAQQVGDVDWKEVRPEHELIVYPLTQAQLSFATQSAYGHEVPVVAVLTNAPRKPGVVETAFEQSPYEHIETEAVYEQSDLRPVPRAYFLYWAQLRTGVDGGRESLDAVAKRLAGRLVFPLEVPRAASTRPRPGLPFMDALRSQLTVGVAEAPADLGRIVAVSGVAAGSGDGASGQAILTGLAIAGVAGWIFYKTVRG